MRYGGFNDDPRFGILSDNMRCNSEFVSCVNITKLPYMLMDSIEVVVRDDAIQVEVTEDVLSSPKALFLEVPNRVAVFHEKCVICPQLPFQIVDALEKWVMEIRGFAVVAVNAGGREVRHFVFPALSHWHDVVYVEAYLRCLSAAVLTREAVTLEDLKAELL